MEKTALAHSHRADRGRGNLVPDFALPKKRDDGGHFVVAG